jgi:hypothetical protein
VSAAAPILRDYQIEDVAAIKAAFAQHRRVLHVDDFDDDLGEPCDAR